MKTLLITTIILLARLGYAEMGSPDWFINELNRQQMEQQQKHYMLQQQQFQRDQLKLQRQQLEEMKRQNQFNTGFPMYQSPW